MLCKEFLNKNVKCFNHVNQAITMFLSEEVTSLPKDKC